MLRNSVGKNCREKLVMELKCSKTILKFKQRYNGLHLLVVHNLYKLKQS